VRQGLFWQLQHSFHNNLYVDVIRKPQNSDDQQYMGNKDKLTLVEDIWWTESNPFWETPSWKILIVLSTHPWVNLHPSDSLEIDTLRKEYNVKKLTTFHPINTNLLFLNFLMRIQSSPQKKKRSPTEEEQFIASHHRNNLLYFTVWYTIRSVTPHKDIHCN
jgi:hypothetical protein